MSDHYPQFDLATSHRPAIPSSAFAIACLHNLLMLSVVVSFLTGLQIGFDHQHSEQLHVFATVLRGWLPQGDLLDWHRISAYLLLLSYVSYLLYALIRNRLRLLMRWNTEHKLRRHYYWIIGGLLVIFVQCLSGFYLYSEISSVQWPRRLHQLLAYGFSVFLLVHLLLIVLAKGPQQLLSMFYWRIEQSWLVVAILALVAVAAVLILQPPVKPLLVTQTQVAPKVDGVANEPVWAKAATVEVLTKFANGSDYYSENRQLSIKAVADHERLYLLLRWPDSEASRHHLPIRKRRGRWMVESADFSRDNEREHYEDKFAVLLSNTTPFDAIRSIHFGMQPLSDQPGSRHGRGLHYTLDGRYLDLWHWKAVRSNDFFQADDGYFGPPKSSLSCAPRYTAGYHSDPVSSGGYKENFAYYAENAVVPLRLPRQRLGEAQLPAVMRWSDGDAFDTVADVAWPDGSAIPAILAIDPFEGDRGDVGARGQWQDGHWTLEISRQLKSNSPFDVPLQEGTYLWFAVFDHAQTRHSYHWWPVQLRGLKPRGPHHES